MCCIGLCAVLGCVLYCAVCCIVLCAVFDGSCTGLCATTCIGCAVFDGQYLDLQEELAEQQPLMEHQQWQSSNISRAAAGQTCCAECFAEHVGWVADAAPPVFMGPRRRRELETRKLLVLEHEVTELRQGLSKPIQVQH